MISLKAKIRNRNNNCCTGLEQGGIDWVCADILVKIVSHYEDSNLADKVGHVRNVTGNICNVYIEEVERVVGLTSEYLEPITPERHDKVRQLSI